MEKTLVILKPDCMDQKLHGVVLHVLAQTGLKLIGCKMMHLGSEILKVHYAHHATKPYFPEIEKFMSARPVMILILEGKNAIQTVRELLGATDPSAATEGTLRRKYGRSKMENIAHASDSPEAAQEEIARFFKKEEVFA